MRHIVDIDALKDFTFEQVVCSASSSTTGKDGFKERKQLVVHVNPYFEDMYYKIYQDADCVFRCTSLTEALNEYNEL